MTGPISRLVPAALLLWLLAQTVFGTWTWADATISAILAIALTLMVPEASKRNGHPVVWSPAAVIAALRFTWWVVSRVITGFLVVFAVVIGLRQAQPTLVTVPCSTWTSREVALATWAITLTPGSFLVRILQHPRRLVLHALDGRDAPRLLAAVESLHREGLRPLFAGRPDVPGPLEGGAGDG